MRLARFAASSKGNRDGLKLAWAGTRGGLGIMILADGVADQQLVRDRPEGFAVVKCWVDTRDTRNVSRATKFCHQFMARLEAAGSRRQLNVDVTQRPIARALADAPICRPEIIEARTSWARSAWVLELFLPAQALNGFDPDTNRRLGFAYQIADHVHDDQFLGVGREFPVGENPSLWATLELRRMINATYRHNLKLSLKKRSYFKGIACLRT